MRRILTLLLICILTLSLVSGCAREKKATQPDPGQYALNAYAPDTVVMTIDGSEVHWNEFAYWLCTTAKARSDDAGGITDWNAASDAASGETYAETLLQTVLAAVKQTHVIESKAAGYGLTLGDEGEIYAENALNEALQSMGIPEGEDRAEALRGFYLDEDVLRTQAKVSYLYLLLYQELFGADGEKLTDEQLQDYIAQNGYVTVRHILLSTVDEQNAPLADDVKEQKHTLAQRIIERLRGIEDPDALIAEFDRYAEAYNEDPGVADYPNGYCFRPGQMDAAFEAASAALQPYEISPEPAESAFGYHVILRLPTTGDDVIDRNADGSAYTLRADAAQATYTALMQGWINDAQIEWADGFETIDVQKLFSKPETFWEKLDVLHWFH